MSTLLVVDDNSASCTAVDLLFSSHGHKVLVAESPTAALALLEHHRVDLVVQDMNFHRDTTSGEEGLELFRAIHKQQPDIPIILLTAWTSVETAVTLMKEGAADYLCKPEDDRKLLTTIHKLLRERAAIGDNQRLKSAGTVARQKLAGAFDLCGMVYESEAMHRVVSLAIQVASSDVPVLITGPNGAGKEKIAEILQANSPLADAPFIRVNVGALPAELMSAELFGADPGAYTGASSKTREGRFEAANGGTLFLDELDTLSLEGQIKLLRVLQTGQFERLGSTKTRQVKVRVISATNADLRAGIRKGTFREDLLYRLNVIELNLPPLAARRDDVMPTARAFIDGAHRFSTEAERALLSYSWPGNVRELQNAVRRACLLATGAEIRPTDLGLQKGSASTQAAASEPDREALQNALASANGVVAVAARELGLSRQALYRRLEKFGIS